MSNPLLDAITAADAALAPVRDALRAGTFPTRDPRRLADARSAVAAHDATLRLLALAVDPRTRARPVAHGVRVATDDGDAS